MCARDEWMGLAKLVGHGFLFSGFLVLVFCFPFFLFSFFFFFHFSFWLCGFFALEDLTGDNELLAGIC